MTEAMSKVVTVGLAGGSASGKSTLVAKLIERVGSDRTAFLAHDSYYIDLHGEDPAAHNFDHPDALETSLLVEHLAALRRGQAVDVPVYDFATHTRSERTERVEARPLVLVEGILLFVEKALRELIDLRVFMDVDAEVRLSRRIRRDVSERARTRDFVLNQYEATVRPMHEEFVEPSKRHAQLVISEGGLDGSAVDLLESHVNRLLAEAGTASTD